MALAAGIRLGPYEVAAPIGAGGMGEVYRGRDTRLQRDVAIKVLPAAFASEPDRRARFEREAQTVATLSHPNIVSIFDTGIHDGQLFVVMELLEGETLRERLTHGPLPVRKAIEYGAQIARGLAAAHAKGLIHRDLKPENVFLLADGQVKILDFGLARQSAGPDGSGASETIAAMTDPGTVMGTVGYMAPEQVRGGAVDARTDLFAFGAVLYEMLTGQRAFLRETPAETMTAILREDPPDLSASRAELSPALERIVRHCLEKNPAERFQTARDVAFALEAFSGTNISSSAVTALSPPRQSNLMRAAAMAGVFLAIGIAAGVGLKSWLSPAVKSPDITFNTRTFDPQWITNSRFAPDGETIVFSAAPSGNLPELFVIRQGASVPQRLGKPHTHLLSVSKTGELAVLTDVTFISHRLFAGTLTRMTIDGAARPWMEKVREADWSPDGSTIAIVRVASETKDQLEYPAGHVLYEPHGYLSDLRVSPDGSRVAFFEHPGHYDDRGWVKVADRGGKITTLTGEYWGLEGLAWSPEGRMVLFSAAGPNGGGYTPRIVNADGNPVDRPAFPSASTTLVMDVAVDGKLLVALSEDRLSMRALLPGETTEREFPWLDLPVALDLSADGKWLFFSDQAQSAGLNYAVGLYKTDGSPAVRLGEGNAIALSPDAKWAIGGILSPPPRFFVMYPTGAGQPVRLDFAPVQIVGNVRFFTDGKIFFCGTEPNHARRCYRKDAPGSAPVPITPENVIEGRPSLDGRTVLTVMPGGKWQIVDVADGSARPVPGDHSNDFVMGWGRGSRSVFVRGSTAVPARIERLDLATGARTFVRELMPPDRSGVTEILQSGAMINDGQAYCYSYSRQVTKAVIVTGVPMRR
jgi:serine/threonine protein kinase